MSMVASHANAVAVCAHRFILGTKKFTHQSFRLSRNGKRVKTNVDQYRIKMTISLVTSVFLTNSTKNAEDCICMFSHACYAHLLWGTVMRREKKNTWGGMLVNIRLLLVNLIQPSWFCRRSSSNFLFVVWQKTAFIVHLFVCICRLQQYFCTKYSICQQLSAVTYSFSCVKFTMLFCKYVLQL